MQRREFFKALPLLPAILWQAHTRQTLPEHKSVGETLTAEEWNALVEAVRELQRV